MARKIEPRKITLVIIGVDNAGKTTTIASLQGEPPDGITPTIGFANKEVDVGKFKVTIYDLGGGARFRDVWKKYYSEIYGVVFVVDSCSQDKLDESRTVLRQVIEHTRISGKPFLIFANKQDQDGALNEEEIADQLELKDLWDKHRFQYNVVPCSALKGYGRKIDNSIKTGLAWLLSAISVDFSKLAARVEHDVAIQKEEEEKERKARLERIRKRREERERQEREAGIKPAEESDNDDIVMGNPFQPIGKHVEKLKEKEKKKKANKAKESKSIENKEPPRSKSPENVQVDKSEGGKKKKKKVVQYSDDVQEAPSINITPASPLNQIEQGLNELSEDFLNEEKIKKKKKKKKPKINEEINNSYELSEISPQNSARESPRKAARKKVKKYEENENDDFTGNESKASIIEVAPRASPRSSPRDSEARSDSPPFMLKSSLFDNETSPRRRQLDPISDSIELDKGHSKTHKKTRNNKYAVNEETERNDSNEVDSDGRPKKKRKKKKKANKTVPVHPGEMNANQNESVLPAPAWRTPREPVKSLPPVKLQKNENAFEYPSFGVHESQGMYQGAKEITSPPSWTRSRPNSDDNDVIT